MTALPIVSRSGLQIGFPVISWVPLQMFSFMYIVGHFLFALILYYLYVCPAKFVQIDILFPFLPILLVSMHKDSSTIIGNCLLAVVCLIFFSL